MGEGVIKDNDGGCEFNYDILTFVNVTMYPKYKNNMAIYIYIYIYMKIK
jgi:hypothetical protein